MLCFGPCSKHRVLEDERADRFQIWKHPKPSSAQPPSEASDSTAPAEHQCADGVTSENIDVTASCRTSGEHSTSTVANLRSVTNQDGIVVKAKQPGISEATAACHCSAKENAEITTFKLTATQPSAALGSPYARQAYGKSHNNGVTQPKSYQDSQLYQLTSNQLAEQPNQVGIGKTGKDSEMHSADAQQPEEEEGRDSFESSASTQGLQEEGQSSSWDWMQHKAPARQSKDFMGQRMSDIRASLDWDFNTATPLAATRRSKEYGEKDQSSSALWAQK